MIYGELIEGETIAVWQAKYFPKQLKAGERRKIEDSFATAIKKATEYGFHVGQWHLVIPYKLTTAELRWWGSFKREREKAHRLAVELWDATELESRLLAREAAALRRIYFDVGDAPAPIPIEVLAEPAQFDLALFIKQLETAGIRETQAARQEFFNAEVLRREVRDKALDDELTELEQRLAEVHSIWEARFAATGPSDEEARQLYAQVHAALEAHHRGSTLRVLRGSLVHTLGLMHFHVDERRAGWIRRWREVADAHPN